MLSEPQVQQRRALSDFRVASGLLLERGVHELKPRRLDELKLISTLALQSLLSHASANCRVRVFSPDFNEKLDRLAGLLRPYCHVDFHHLSLSQLLDTVCRASNDSDQAADLSCIVICGSTSLPLTATHESLAKSLAMQNREFELRTGRNVLRSTRTYARSNFAGAVMHMSQVIVEEKPGKAQLLSLKEPSFKQAQRRWQTIVSKKPYELNRHPVDVSEGWGVGALSYVTGPSRTTRKSERCIQMASIDLRFDSEIMSLVSLQKLLERMVDWLLELGVELTDLRSITYSIPYPIIAGQLSHLINQQLEKSVKHTRKSSSLQEYFPEFLWGWQPLLSCLEFVAEASPPALFIETGHFPIVHLLLVHGRCDD